MGVILLTDRAHGRHFRDRRTKMHLFPTNLAYFECSSINSESQSRPLAVEPSSVQTSEENTSKRTKGEGHEQEGTNRRHETYGPESRISFWNEKYSKDDLYGP